MSTSLPVGQRVVVSEFGDEPLQAIESFATLVPQPAPEPATLGPRDVIIAVRSASVGWAMLPALRNSAWARWRR